MRAARNLGRFTPATTSSRPSWPACAAHASAASQRPGPAIDRYYEQIRINMHALFDNLGIKHRQQIVERRSASS
jgi:hypothetical protein